jgi:hypothetical protein
LIKEDVPSKQIISISEFGFKNSIGFFQIFSLQSAIGSCSFSKKGISPLNAQNTPQTN